MSTATKAQRNGLTVALPTKQIALRPWLRSAVNFTPDRENTASADHRSQNRKIQIWAAKSIAIWGIRNGKRSAALPKWKPLVAWSFTAEIYTSARYTSQRLSGGTTAAKSGPRSL